MFDIRKMLEVTHWPRTILYITVFSTGAIVLILEILAVRLLSPYFGTSLFVLSSVLTVVLAALSLGYFYGGRLADRKPEILVLYCILGLGAFFLLFLYTLAKLILPSGPELLPITTGPLVFSCLFFFLPAFLLGIDSPFVIKLLEQQEKQHGDVGKLAGTTFFFSTLGSIVGSLSAGFFFIPFIGIENTIILCSLYLALLAFLSPYLLSCFDVNSNNKRWQWCLNITTLATIILVFFTFFSSPTNAPEELGKVIYQTDGYYGHIKVIAGYDPKTNRPTHILQREVNSESAVFLDSYDHVFDYAKFSEVYHSLRSATTSSFLMLGGGAYTIPRILMHNDPNLKIDVVELEPKLLPIAREYFGLVTNNLFTNHQMDARVFLETTNKKFDVVFIDVFNSGHFTPPHLSSKEFFSLVRSRLNNEGLLIINFIGARNQPGQNLTDSFYLTLKSTFPNTKSFSTARVPETIQNIVFIAKNSENLIIPKGTTIPLAFSQPPVTWPVPIHTLEFDLQATDPQLQTIFTDNNSPVEYLIAKQIKQTQKKRI